jgi:hypothetical protein
MLVRVLQLILRRGKWWDEEEERFISRLVFQSSAHLRGTTGDVEALKISSGSLPTLPFTLPLSPHFLVPPFISTAFSPSASFKERVRARQELSLSMHWTQSKVRHTFHRAPLPFPAHFPLLSSRMSPTLPPELVEKVLVHAVDGCEATKKDLLNVCLASKHFFEIAFPILRFEWVVGYGWERTEEEEERQIAKWNKLTTPSFASWVVSLEVCSLPDKHLVDLEKFKATLVALSIYYDQHEYPAQGLSTFSGLQHLTFLSLTLSSMFEDSAFLLEVLQSLEALCSLKHLALDQWIAGDDEIEGVTALSFAPSLIAFHVRDLAGANATPLLEHLCTSSGILHLLHLTLFDVPAPTVSHIVQAHTSSLRTLSLSLDPDPASYAFLHDPALSFRTVGIDVSTGTPALFAVAFLSLEGILSTSTSTSPRLPAPRFSAAEVCVTGHTTSDAEECADLLRTCVDVGYSRPLYANSVLGRMLPSFKTVEAGQEQRSFVAFVVVMLGLKGGLKPILPWFVESLWPSFPPGNTEQLLRRGEALRREAEAGGLGATAVAP